MKTEREFDFHKKLFTLILLLFSIFLFSGTPSFGAIIPEGGGNSDLLQFTSAGHVLGFKPEGVYVASGDHMVNVTFQNARNVQPVSEQGQPSDKKAQPLTKVTYPELWKGISLTYDGIKQGIIRSTYTIQPGAKVKDIRLQYNTPLEIDSKGTLRLKYPNGDMTESAPVAWQEINGKRVSVNVAFKKLGKQEIGFDVGSYNNGYSLIIDPTLEWSTFLGDSSWNIVAVDKSGNIYITGYAGRSWGSPIRPYSGGYDAVVAKLNSSGVLQWNTFLGSSGNDYGSALAVDTNGNVYITGYGLASWGSPIQPFSGGPDAFVAKLNSSGDLQWNTFLGTNAAGLNLALDTSGNIYITGDSYTSWGSPIRPFSGGPDAFVAKLNSSGDLQWNTFLGSYNAYGLAVDTNGNVYITGYSPATWGSPIRPFSGGVDGDAYVAKLSSSGDFQWNTFLGSSSYDVGINLAVDTGGNVYVVGSSNGTWGSPIQSYSGGLDAFVAKLNGSGDLQWNTFLGSSGDDYGFGLALDTGGNVFISGHSNASWGSPTWPFTGGLDAYVAKLNSNGDLQWNTFLGSSGNDYGSGLAIDTSGNIYVTGQSWASWGSPIQPYSGGVNAFVVKIKDDTAVNLPQTGQTICYDTAGTVIPCAGTGQDGEIRAGAAWPNPRFSVNGDCVTDNLTGLMWPKDGNIPNGVMNWNGAIDFANNLTLCGYSDWRLPNWNELQSLLNFDQLDPGAWLNTQGFQNVQLFGYWSSSSSYWGGGEAYRAFILSFGRNPLEYGNAADKGAGFYVWPTRAGQSGSSGTALTWRTGQTQSFAARDDGALQQGVPWPSPRFNDKGDQTVIDNLTGLVWTKDTYAPGPSQCLPATSKTFQGAIDYVKCLNSSNYLGHHDWRLPNAKELFSLLDHTKNYPALPSNHPFIITKTDRQYWSSTAWIAQTNAQFDAVWIVRLGDGGFDAVTKSDHFMDVWPVRAGQVVPSDPLHHFEFSTISSQTVGVSFPVTITAKDANGNTVTDFNGSVTLGASIGSVSPASISLTSGTWSGNISLNTAGNNIQITASGNGKQGQSNAFNVVGKPNSLLVLNDIYGCAEGTYEIIGLDPLKAYLEFNTVARSIFGYDGPMNFWMSISVSASPAVIWGPASDFSAGATLARYGFVSPSVSPKYEAQFVHLSDEITFILSFDEKAFWLTFQEIIINGIVQGLGYPIPSASDMIEATNDLLSLAPFREAYDALKGISTKGKGQQVLAATKAINSLRRIVTNPVDEKAFLAVLSIILKKEISEPKWWNRILAPVLSIWNILNLISDEAVLMIQTGGEPLQVEYLAQYQAN
jgi:hypothetical protein